MSVTRFIANPSLQYGGTKRHLLNPHAQILRQMPATSLYVDPEMHLVEGDGVLNGVDGEYLAPVSSGVLPTRVFDASMDRWYYQSKSSDPTGVLRSQPGVVLTSSTAPKTISLVARNGSTVAGNLASLAGSTQDALGIILRSDGGLVVRGYDSGGTGLTAEFSVSAAAGEAHHIVLAISETESKLFLDGALAGTIADTITVAASNFVLFGAYQNSAVVSGTYARSGRVYLATVVQGYADEDTPLLAALMGDAQARFPSIAWA